MPDEQIIYLDPDDELTRVREKIEKVGPRHIILVVPQRTQLRYHTAWRLLHARARELGKDVQVISPDSQVRAVAKAAGFHVSKSPEGSAGGRTRIPASSQQNPRNAVERKGAKRERAIFNRGSAQSQPQQTRTQFRRQPGAPLPSPSPEPEPEPEDVQTETLPPRSTWTQQEHAPASPQEPAESMGKQGQEESYPPLVIEEDTDYDRPYEFRIDDAGQPGSSRPLAAHPEEEDEDRFMQDMQDFETQRQIRAAHEEGKTSRASNPPASEHDPISAFPSSPVGAGAAGDEEWGRLRRPTPPELAHANPFEGGEDIEELSPSLRVEQHGSTFPPDVDEIVPNVADIPTQEYQIEEVVEPVDSQDFPVRQWENAPLDLQDDRFSAPAPATDTGTGTRGGRRSGKLPRSYEEEDADFLPPADRSTIMRSNRPAPTGPIGARGARNRGAQVPPPPPAASPQSAAPRQSAAQPAARNVTTRPVAQTPRSGQPPITRNKVPAAPPAPRRTRQPSSSSRRSGVVTIAVIAALVLLLLVGVGLFYFGTTATVTITVPSKSITLNAFKLVASTSTKSKFPNSVTSQVLTYTASATGTGTATGHSSQGNQVASGIVNFTNNGTQLVTVPSGTQLSTNAGNGSIAFVTAATAVIPQASNGTTFVPVPVKALNAGSSGNVAANTITVVPSTSITAIAQASQLSTAQINLSVTNPAALTGGGATQVPTVTQNDLQALTNSLHSQLQSQVKAWLQKQLHQGDIAGKFFPDVVDSAQPLKEEHLTQAPAAGTALPGKTFSGTLVVPVNVLVVRSTNLIAAAQTQLNKAASPYVLSTQQPIQVSKVSSSPSADGKTITITMSASGLAMSPVDTRAVSMYIAGKTEDQARSAINAGDAGPRGVQKVEITITPSFLSLMPFRPDNIHITVIPGAQVKG